MAARIWLVAGVMVTLAGTAAAQSRQTVSLQASALVTTINGPSFENYGLSAAPGGELQVRVNIQPGDFSLGGGFQFSKHTGTFNATDSKVNLTGFFLEPRYAIRTTSRTLRPYLAGRIALLKQALSYGSGTGAIDVTANGTAFGGGGGFAVRLSPNVNFDLGAAFTSANFGEYKDNGTPTGEDAKGGSSYVIKAGVTIGIGK